MQKYFIFSILVCLLCACEKSDKKPLKPKYVVLTRVVHILPTEYSEGKEMKEIFAYNSFGYENGYALYVNGEKVEERKNYQHDEQGREIHWEFLGPTGEKGLTMDYTYSASGKVVLEDKIFHSYTKNDYTVEEKHYIKEYTYDNQDREICVLSYLNGEVFSTYKNYKYDKDDNLLQWEDMDENGKLQMKYEASYDNKGKMITNVVSSYMTFFDFVMRYEYSYDSSGKLISMKEYLDGKFVNEMKDYTYDEAENVLSSKLCGIDGSVLTEYYYTYQKFE